MVVRTNSYESRTGNSMKPESKGWSLKPTHTSILAWHIMALLYYCYVLPSCKAQGTGKVRTVDLSHTFDDSTIYWVTAKQLDLTVTHNGTDRGNNYWYQSDEITAGTHGGTHMDSPCHFALGKWSITDIPIEHLVVPAAIVDISSYVANDATVHLSVNHLTAWEKIHGQIPDGSLLLIRTGWSRFWPDPLTYSGTTERKSDLLKFPSIEAEVAKWLVANRKIVGIGIDVMSIDIPQSKKEVHRTLMDKNIYALENVNMPEPLPPVGVKVYAMPMKLRNASGAPCRVFAEVPDDMTSRNASSSNSIQLILMIISIFRALRNLRF